MKILNHFLDQRLMPLVMPLQDKYQEVEQRVVRVGNTKILLDFIIFLENLLTILLLGTIISSVLDLAFN